MGYSQGRAPLEVGALSGFSVVRFDNGFGSLGGNMHGTVTQINFRLPIVESKAGSGLRSSVMSGIVVCHGITLSNAMVRKIEIAVRCAVAPHQKPSVPVFRQRELHMVMDPRRDQPAHITILGRGSLRLHQLGGQNCQVWNTDQRKAGLLLV